MFKVDLYHNILWSKYKAKVFNELYKLNNDLIDITFYQIYETENNRKLLSKVDNSIHNYEYKLIFKNSYEDIPFFQKIYKLIKSIYSSDASLVLLPGFSHIEYWAMLLVARLMNKKVGVFCDSTSNDRKKSFFKRVLKILFLKNCDLAFCYGLRSKQYILSLNFPEMKIIERCQSSFLPPSYNEFSIPNLRFNLINQLNNNPPFLYVGRLSTEKNLFKMIDAFYLYSKFDNSSILNIVGNGDLFSSLFDYVNKLKLSNSVFFLGGMDSEELSQMYLKSKCLILPSTSEPWGLVVNEALSYGCPVIVSDKCGCIPELVLNGITGYVFDSTDSKDLFNCMMKINSEFTDTNLVTYECLKLISCFSPINAASQIYSGIKKVSLI